MYCVAIAGVCGMQNDNVNFTN